MANIQQTTAREKYWQELRHHIEWTQGFGLYFYFTDNTELLTFLKERLQQFLIGQTTRLQTITYNSDDPQWIESTLEQLLSRDEKWRLLHAPVWLDLSQKGNTETAKQTKQDYLNLLLRLNERRDSLRKHYHSPVILSFPLSFQEDCRLAAPDLWSVRNFSETIVIENNRISTPDKPPATIENINSKLSAKHQQTIIKEWERLKTSITNDVGILRASQRAVLAYLRLGNIKEASITAEKSVEIARSFKETPPSPQTLRDLSVSLNMVGKVAQQQGRWNDAHENYKESLDIRRRLSEMLGETPESLRDLSVSLDNVGKVAQQQGRWNDAHENYKESLDIRRRLSEMLGETPESLRDLSVSLYNLGCNFEEQDEKGKAQIAFQEGFDIAERLAEMQPDIPSYTEVVSYFVKKLDSAFIKTDKNSEK